MFFRFFSPGYVESEEDYNSVIPDDKKWPSLGFKFLIFLTTHAPHNLHFNLSSRENPERANVMTSTQGIAGHVSCSTFFRSIEQSFIWSNRVQSDTFSSSGRPVGFFAALAS